MAKPKKRKPEQKRAQRPQGGALRSKPVTMELQWRGEIPWELIVALIALFQIL